MSAAQDEPIQLAAAFPFEVLRKVGEGATSEVFRGRDLRSGEFVALKVGKSDDARLAFANEAEKLALHTSPRLPKLIDLGIVPEDSATWPGLPYLALSWIDAKSLDLREERSPRERYALALALARDVGEALASLHEGGLAHGDIKPGNILVRGDGREGFEAFVVDLGLADDADAELPTGGTPRYLPPLAWNEGGDGRARDRLALGIVLAEALDPLVVLAGDALTQAREAKLPSPFDSLCAALLAKTPGARPKSAWVASQARARLSESGESLDHRERVRAAYLSSRQAEIADAARSSEFFVEASGEAGRWLSEAVEISRKCAELRGEAKIEGREALLADADELTRARWLLHLVGAPAASWPLSGFAGYDDASLADALLGLVSKRDPASLELSAVERALRGDDASPPLPSDEPTEPEARATRLALSLAVSPPCRAAIFEVETRGGPRELVRAAADALRRLGENGRALALLNRDDSPEGLALRADVARRAGELEAAETWAREARGRGCDAAAAVLARIQIDRGDVEGAAQTLEGASRTAGVSEARALLALARGDRDGALREARLGETLAHTDEAHARLSGLRGYIAHAAGNVTQAAEDFSRAAEHASRASALVEEATYRTGEAAAATDCGDVELALAASRRASLLWEYLDRPADAARALLARAATFAMVGASHEAHSLSLEARERARRAGDRRAEAFAWWPVVDVLEAGAPDAIFAAQRALALLKNDEDRLRGLSRLLRHAPEDMNLEDLSWGDELATGEDCAPSARLEWWGARALTHAETESVGRPASIVREIVRLADGPAPISSRGPALHAGAKLAGQIYDGDSLRFLLRAQSETARRLVEGAPKELRESIHALPWVRDAHALEAPGISAEQLTDIEALVRALGTRDRLRPLLEQVLDSLVLWTGVERGLLLLKAPGGKLSPRAARNLKREDLEGEQRALSQTLAQRAMDLREPVVAVDAFGKLSDLHASVMALKLRSVLAVPLIARGEALGVVYLDDRERRGAFGPNELAWVRLVATLAAVAIAEARDQLLLRRAARKAKRAQKRLAEELARQEAELKIAKLELSRTKTSTRYPYDDIIGNSEPLRKMLSLVDRITETSVPVLLIGESGSGKELIARALHRNGPRKDHAFVGENCGAIPETLLESTLFGHVRGAFTGADRPRAGLFEIAHQGTLFLDEIGEMPLSMQIKLLRVLETGEVRPLGTERGRRVDVRIVAATHRDLRKMVEDGRFREDLYYRLDVITVRIPPLRERVDDVALLVSHFIDKHADRERARISKEALTLMSAYPWPGNVRQLENEVRRALVLSDGLILPEHLSNEIREGGQGQRERELGLNLRARVDALQTELLREALGRTEGNQTRAAELLGLSRFGLQKMMKRLGVRG